MAPPSLFLVYFMDYEKKLLLQRRYVIILFAIFLFHCLYYYLNLLIVIESDNIIINKLSEIHRHPILFLRFFSIPTLFHFLNFLYDWFILFFY